MQGQGNIKRAFIPQTRLFFPVLHYLCRMKTLYIVLGSISLGLGILGIFPAVTAYYSFSITYRRTLFQRVALIIQLVAESPALRSVHPQLP